MYPPVNIINLIVSNISMGFLSAFLRLTRFEHAIMLAIAVFIGEAIVSHAIPPFSFVLVLSLLVPIFSEMGSFSLNDYLDVESDRINKRNDRPLVTREISPVFALYFSVLSILISILLSYSINLYAFVIALIFNILAIAYNYKLKDLPLVGNIYIGLSMAIPFLFGSVVMLNSFIFDPVILSLFLISFVAGVAREIIKSVEDMEGDKKARKSKTFPILIGEKNARIVASILYLIFIPLAFAPFYFGLKQTNLALLLVGVADLGILYIIYLVLSDGTQKTLKRARSLSLFCLFLGLAGLLVAAIF